MAAFIDTSRPQVLSRRIVWKEANGEMLGFDPESLAVHELNASLSEVARMCDGASPVEEIVVAFAERYGLDVESASGEVYNALKTLRDQDLLETE